MKRLWEKFEIKISTSDIEILSVRSVRQLRPYQNIYGLNLSAIHSDPNANGVLIVQKKLGFILGFIKFQASAVGSELLASQRFDTFPIERLDLNCLEIVDFEIAEPAWNRLGFKQSLVSATLHVMEELGSEALIVHYLEKVENAELFSRQIAQLPFYSPLIFCEKYRQGEEVVIDSYQKPNDEDRSYLPSNLSQLLNCGLELWSEPIFYRANESVSLLLGYLSRKGLAQARPLAVHRQYHK